MSTSHWKLLESVQTRMKRTSDVPASLSGSLATRIEEALSSHTREHLVGLANQLEGFARALLSVVDPTVSAAARGKLAAEDPLNAALLLGKYSFAQELMAMAAERRADEKFVETILHENYRKYIYALLTTSKSNTELANIMRLRPETVSRCMAHLRRLGITDFRREGNSVKNFLTPAARAIVEEKMQNVSAPIANPVGLELATIAPAAAPLLTTLKQHLPSYLQSVQGFAEERHVEEVE